MQKQFEVDIDSEKIRFEGEWLGRKELAEKIRQMIDNRDFRIASAGSALEYLQNALANASEFSIKLPPEDAELLAQHADRARLSVSTFIRQALQAYLAAQVPLAQRTAARDPLNAGPPPIPARTAVPAPAATPAPAVATSITTEPAQPEEEAHALELTERKTQKGIPTVVIDPSLGGGAEPEKDQAPAPRSSEDPLADSWFKK